MKSIFKIIVIVLCAIQSINVLAQNYVHEVDKAKFSFQHPGLESYATIIATTSPVKLGNIPLKVYSYNLYPIMGCVTGDCGLEASKNWALEDLHEKPYYIGIIKEITRDDNSSGIAPEWRVRFTVDIKLPEDTMAYDQIDGLEREALKNLVQQAIDAKYNTMTGFEMGQAVTLAEIKGLEEFIGKLSLLRGGGELNSLEINGYIKLNNENLEWDIEENLRENVSSDRNGNNVFNYSNLRLKIGNGTFQDYEDVVKSSFDYLENSLLFKNSIGYVNTSHYALIHGKVSEAEYEKICKDNGFNILVISVADFLHYHIRIYIYKDAVFDEIATQVLSEPLVHYQSIYGGSNYEWLDNQKELELPFTNSPTSQNRNPINDFPTSQDNITKAYLLNSLGEFDFKSGIGVGVIGGAELAIRSTLALVEGISGAVVNTLFNSDEEIQQIIRKTVRAYVFIRSQDLSIEAAKDFCYLLIENIVNIYNNRHEFIEAAYTAIKEWIGFITSGTKEAGYSLGVIVFNLIIENVSIGLPIIKYFYKIAEIFIDFSKSKVTGFFKDMLDRADASPNTRNFFCKIGIGGCFVKDTPVLMANNNLFRNTVTTYAAAAIPLVTPVSIQNVQLLDYALTHKSINLSSSLTANADDTYTTGKDPYTSDEQRSRDKYEINDLDWNEVTFEQVLGSSKCKLALHKDWINNNNYSINAIVIINLPEQGISGPFQITSIKHIKPQKKPVDDNENDEYDYKPVTGLFTHQFNDVWNIKFENGTELGVTNNHPIFSVSKGDWQHAGHLEIGEEVLAKSGNTKVAFKERYQTLQPVYNLEVKDLHNFLVGNVGVVVHNTGNCSAIIDKFIEKTPDLKDLKIGRLFPGKKKSMPSSKPDYTKIKDKFDRDYVCYDDLGFPDLSPFVPEINGVLAVVEIDMVGDHKNNGDYEKAAQKLCEKLGIPFQHFHGSNTTFDGKDEITFTWHHHQDGKSMMLVPTDLHGSVGHSGGATIATASTNGKNYKGLFPGPDQVGNYLTICND